MLGDPTNNSIISITSIIAYFGICLILFFITLILFSKKNKTVEGYFSAVASNSIFDLIFAITTAIAKMNCFHKNGFFVFAIGRFDYELDPSLTKIIVIGHLFIGHMCIYNIYIPFYIRYLLICKRQNVYSTVRILLYIFVITYDIGNSSLLYLAFESSPRELVDLQMKPYLQGYEEGRYWNFAGGIVVS